MDKFNRKIEQLRNFYRYMDKNIFCTRDIYKLENEVKISNIFPIYIKNPNYKELEYIIENNYRILFSIVSIFPNLEYMLKIEDYSIEDKYYAFKDQIRNIQMLYEEYLLKNNNTFIKKAVEDNDINSFCAYLTFLREDIIIIEVKDWKKIDKFIMKYYNCNYNEIEDLEYRDYFIKQYLNLFNIVNFDLTTYQGISLINSDNVLIKPIYIDEQYNKIFSQVILNPYIIDSFIVNDTQVMDLFFIINNFEKVRYLKERKFIVDFVTCLEFFLVKNSRSSNNKIENQFKFKIRKCCQEVGYAVPINEIRDLYDYRSLVVHGNFKKINQKIQQITNKQWYVNYSKGFEIEGATSYHDNSDKEYFIYCRLYQIFNIIFRLYCEKNEVINKLKEKTEKLEIESLKFDF